MAIVSGMVIIAIAALALVPQLMRLRRLARKSRIEQPEWSARWKRAGWAGRRRIMRAMRHGDTLYDPEDAQLLVGLSRRADMYHETAGRRWLFESSFITAALIFGIATWNVGLTVETLVVLSAVLLFRGALLPRQRERRRRTAAANEQLHGDLSHPGPLRARRSG
jgi:Flp pilus assembly protein TadB